MNCAAVAPWGEACILDASHRGDHLTETQRTAREAAAVRWRAERDLFWAASAARAEAARRAKVREVLVPVVLVPTMAQRAAGQRLVDARDDQMPKAARELVASIADALVRVTYAHALRPPKGKAEDWWDNHTIAVRVQRIDGRGWGVWSNGGWDGGQWAAAGAIRSVGAEEFSCLARGVPFVVVPPATCPACGKLVRVKKDGGLWAHACAVVSDVQLDSQARVLVGSAA